MIAVDFGIDRVDDVLRVVGALGAHRYVAGRLHLIHALCLDAIGDGAGGPLAEARAWAGATLAGGVDPASRDERLWRRCSDAELAAVLEAYWAPRDASRAARDALRARLDEHGLTPGTHAPFDEAAEATAHPIAVDAGWELLALSRLDAERHKGAIAAFDGPRAFESARIEEEAAIPPPAHLYELPAIGAVELLRGVGDDGRLAEPFVVWAQGDATYVDYVLRGVKRAARVG